MISLSTSRLIINTQRLNIIRVWENDVNNFLILLIFMQHTKRKIPMLILAGEEDCIYCSFDWVAIDIYLELPH